MNIKDELIKYAKWYDRSTMPEDAQTDEADLVQNVESYLQNYSKKLRNYAANYGFRKDGYTHFFKAYNKEHARQLALEYQKEDNKGECKSDRISLKSITEVVEK